MQAEKKHEQRILILKETQRLMTELEAHQVKLEMQNEELRQTQASLEEAGEKYYDMYEFAPVGYLLFNEAGLILEANQTTANLLGVTKTRLLNQNLSQFIFSEDQDVHHQAWKKLFQTKAPQVWAVRMNPIGKAPIWLRIRANIRQKRSLFFCRMILDDITDRKQMVADLVRAKKSAQSANRTKTEFMAKMSHELRTPLAGILGMADICLSMNAGPQMDDYLNSIKYAAFNLRTLINDLLDLSKIEMGKFELNFEPFNFQDMMFQTVELFKIPAQQKNLELNLFVETTIPEKLIGDERRLAQILSNLISNALKFTASGKLAIAVVPEDSLVAARDDPDRIPHIKLKFSVSDTGVGIPKEQQAGIFEMFSQAGKNVAEKVDGSGMGLAICRQLVSMMQGDIWLESQYGQGSCFFFTAMFEYPPDQNPKRLKEKKPEDPEGEMSTEPSKGKILVVEDNKLLQKVLSHIIAQFECDFRVAGNGKEALAAIEQEWFDLIFMDVHMPEMNGIEATKCIRGSSESSYSQVPIIALTAYAMKGDKERLLAAGMDDYISKPIDVKEIERVMKKFLGKTRFANNG